MIFNLGKGNEPTELEDIRSMLLHLEDEYRKANISEKNYWELKQKYTEKIRKLDKNFDKKDSEKNPPPSEGLKKAKKKEREDIEMFLESLEEQYRRGEINKEEYENIKHINQERLNDIDDYVKIDLKDVEKEKEEPGEIELEMKEKERKGVLQKLFGKLKGEKKEEGKIEIDVPEEVEENEPDGARIEDESEEVELKSGKGGELQMEIKDEQVPVEEPEMEKVEEEVKIPEEKVVEMPEEKNVETENAEEKPKKKGFLKSIFSKKKEETNKEETKPEKVQENKEESPKEEKQKGEAKPEEKKKETKTEEKVKEKEEEAPKEEPKKEEKKLEVGEIEEVTPEVIEKLAAQMAEEEGAEPVAETEEKEEETEETAEEAATGSAATRKLGVEIEKLKVMIDAMRESKQTTDETIQNLSENLGEIRSLVMQTDANFKTSLSKMEKMEDEITEVRPREITKKFNETREKFEKNELEMEKFKQKLNGIEEKVNEVNDMLKNIGSVENLTNLNKNIQEKLKDISEAIKYIQRIGTRTEKIFIDLNKGLEDLVLIKAKQEDYDESLKNVLASVDSMNIKFKDYVEKDDLNVFREDNLLIKKELEKINKVLPVAEIKLPENVIKLRKEREDIEMFLESLESQFASNKISKAEYEDVRRSNLKKLDDIEDKLQKEWKNIDEMIKGEKPEETPKEEKPKKKTKKKPKKKIKKKGSQRSRKKKILSDLKKLE